MMFKRLFENIRNLQQIDEALIGTINECRKHLPSGKIVKLFESVKFDEDFNEKPLLQLKDFYGNKFAYFNNVKQLMESQETPFTKSTLFENEDFNNFKFELNEEINNLLKINDFRKFLSLDPLILKTKLFSKSELSVHGFNVNSFNEILKGFNIGKCFMIIYCKSNKTLIFPTTTNEIFTYSILTGNLEKLDISNIKINQDNVYNIINDNYSKNIIVIYDNVTVDFAKSKIKDNIFSDKSLGAGWKRKFQNLSQQSIIKK